MNKNKLIIIIAAFFLISSSCRKKPDPVTTNPTNNLFGTIGFEISNYAGSKLLTLNTDTFITAMGDTITPTIFNYYISNIKLTRIDGTEFQEDESYHLVKDNMPGSKHFHLKNVPSGTYTSMTFMIGVDSLRNIIGAQTGALDPVNGMFWEWSTGYVMAKVEGISPQATTTDKKFMHHIGGFSGSVKAQRLVTFTFADQLVLGEGQEGSIRIKSDILKWFNGPTNISLATTSTIMSPSASSKNIADNYASMFTISSITVQ